MDDPLAPKVTRDTLPEKKSFSLLTPVEYAESLNVNGKHRRMVKCKCECGNEIVILLQSLKYKKSCGCRSPHDHFVQDGRKKEKEYWIWIRMRNRCGDKNTPYFKNYGGRGIKVCDRWLDYRSFVADMGRCPDGMSIERKNVDGGYYPGNCCWATNLEQQRNRRTTIFHTHNGTIKPISQWCSELGINYVSAMARYYRGKNPLEVKPRAQTVV